MFREDLFMRSLRASFLLTSFAIALIAACSPFLTAQGELDSALAPYTSCKFSDGLQVVETDPLPPGITSREVDTDSGPRKIDMEAGIRVMFAYPATDFYANAKAELLPATNYAQLKQFLLDNLQHLAQGNIMNTSLASPLNGLEAHGLDREKLEGGTLGVYLLFDNSAHVVTTIYLLNQEPQSRKFQSFEEYRQLRDRFLVSYSACIQKNQQNKQ
jgi:hypothetical protein